MADAMLRLKRVGIAADIDELVALYKAGPGRFRMNVEELIYK